MNQVILADGVLYSGVNSKPSVGGASQTGIAWFAVQPRFQGPTLKGKVIKQDYVAIKGNNAIFPSVGVNDDGEGVIVFTLVGQDYFPSVAYVTLESDPWGDFVHIAGVGKDPEDGFTGYPQYGGAGVARWGDYSAATWDGDAIWFAGEYIPSACASLTTSCRTSLANWGTFVGTAHP